MLIAFRGRFILMLRRYNIAFDIRLTVPLLATVDWKDVFDTNDLRVCSWVLCRWDLGSILHIDRL